MKRFAVLFAASAVCICASAAMAKSPAGTEPVKTISTEGSAKIWISPDRARLYLGVETQDKTLEGARQRNAETINRIMSRLQSLEIQDMHVQSPAYNVALVKEDEHVAKKELRLPAILGYKITQQFTVLIKNEDMSALSANAGLVLDTALQSGVNIIDQNIMFFKEDVSREKEEVLKLALKDAISRAKVIADTAGMTIKEYSSINSGFFFGPRRSVYSQVSQSLSPAFSEDTASSVMAAKIPVEASVSLTCIMK